MNHFENTVQITMYIQPVFYVNARALRSVPREERLAARPDGKQCGIIYGPGWRDWPGEELENPVKDQWKRFLDDCEFYVKNSGFSLLASEQQVDREKAGYRLSFGVGDVPCGQLSFDLLVSEQPFAESFPEAAKDEVRKCLKMDRILAGDTFRDDGIDFRVNSVTVGNSKFDSWLRAIDRMNGRLDRIRAKVPMPGEDGRNLKDASQLVSKRLLCCVSAITNQLWAAGTDAVRAANRALMTAVSDYDVIPVYGCWTEAETRHTVLGFIVLAPENAYYSPSGKELFAMHMAAIGKRFDQEDVQVIDWRVLDAKNADGAYSHIREFFGKFQGIIGGTGFQVHAASTVYPRYRALCRQDTMFRPSSRNDTKRVEEFFRSPFGVRRLLLTNLDLRYQPYLKQVREIVDSMKDPDETDWSTEDIDVAICRHDASFDPVPYPICRIDILGGTDEMYMEPPTGYEDEDYDQQVWDEYYLGLPDEYILDVPPETIHRFENFNLLARIAWLNPQLLSEKQKQYIENALAVRTWEPHETADEGGSGSGGLHPSLRIEIHDVPVYYVEWPDSPNSFDYLKECMEDFF